MTARNVRRNFGHVLSANGTDAIGGTRSDHAGPAAAVKALSAAGYWRVLRSASTHPVLRDGGKSMAAVRTLADGGGDWK